MEEFQEIARWINSHPSAIHGIPKVGSLPNPVFSYEGQDVVSFSSNNYLALAHDPRVIKAAQDGAAKFGVANCESRILGGDMDIYLDLEAKLAALKGKESALMFATGFLTNLGALSALPNSGLLPRIYGFRPGKKHTYAYFSDELNHVSIREGIKLSGVPKTGYRHLDLEDLEGKMKASSANCKIIVTDGVFSMDGDIAPLPELLEIADRHDAMLYVDDAHGTGVLGATGGGTTEHFGVSSPRLISMGTFSKAYGSIGGFIATDKYIVDILRLTSSSYGFTSPITPDQVCAVSTAIDIVKNEPERRQRLWDNQRHFIRQAERAGMTVVCKETCIVPVLVGSEERCELFSKGLLARGFLVDAIIFPAVKRGQARLRFNMNAHHTHGQIDRLVAALQELQRRHGASAG